MNKIVLSTIKNSRATQAVLVLFVILSLWWLTIYFRGLTEGFENNSFTLIYPLMSLFGAIWGMRSARLWGSYKSYLGKALLGLSLGLFFQFLGQAIYAIYIYIFAVEIPYPSFGDIGYFGSIFFYTYAALMINKVIGVNFSFKNNISKILALILPVIVLLLSYFVFLRGYDFSEVSFMQSFLDFGYPLGQSIYVSIALLGFLLAKKFLGGAMKIPSLLLLFALVFQYFSDYIFLLQYSKDEWYIGGLNDYMYFLSYCLMTLALLVLKHVFDEIRGT